MRWELSIWLMTGSVCLILHCESLMPAAYVFTVGAERQGLFKPFWEIVRFLDLKMT